MTTSADIGGVPSRLGNSTKPKVIKVKAPNTSIKILKPKKWFYLILSFYIVSFKNSKRS